MSAAAPISAAMKQHVTACLIRNKRFIPHLPHPRQLAFLCSQEEEVFFGGAAGGGKSDALLMAALMYVDRPKYSAIIIRRTSVDLSASGGLVPRSHEWLANSGATWNEQKKLWTFPSGATLKFGHCEIEKDRFKYGSQEYQFIAFEGSTEVMQSQYLYIM